MESKIVGRKIAKGQVKYVPGQKTGEYIFKGGDMELVVPKEQLETHGVSESLLRECMAKLQEMGTYEELCKRYGYKGEGVKNAGIVIVSDNDPRISMSVQFGSTWHNESEYQWLNRNPADFTCCWFLDVDGSNKEKGVQEREVSPEELDLISKIRQETKLEEYQPFKVFRRELVDLEFPLPEQVMEEGTKMLFTEDFDQVDFFGIPLFEEAVKETALPAKEIQTKDVASYEKKIEAMADDLDAKEEKPVVVGDSIAKVEVVGKEVVKEQELSDKALKVGEPGEAHGEHAEGKGKSDDQQTEVPASAIKLQKPGKVYGESIWRRRFERVLRENHALKTKMSAILDRVTKLEEASTAPAVAAETTAAVAPAIVAAAVAPAAAVATPAAEPVVASVATPVTESKLQTARQRMELKRAEIKSRMAKIKTKGEPKKEEAPVKEESKKVARPALTEEERMHIRAKIRERHAAKKEKAAAEKAL